MRFDQDFIDKVVEANDLVELISQHSELKNAGSNLTGLCPFPDHKEKTPSFSVSATKQVYHCFGCKKGGNIIHFLQDYNGCTFVESVEYLAKRASIELPRTEVPSKEIDLARKHKNQLEKANEIAYHYYYQQFKKLPAGHIAKTYLKDRGLSEEVLEVFKVSYADDSWDSIVKEFSVKSVPMNLPIELGLIKKKSNGSGYFDIFRKRILFPIFSPMGKPLGFGGRVLSKDDQPKYLNSPESKIFYKGKMLYGLHETAKYIRSADQTIVVEGYMDLVSLYQAGIKNVAANCGTAFTAEQANLLKKYSNHVVLLFDGDKAGQSAMRRALPILLSAGIFAKGLSLPGGQDPDDFVKTNGAEALQAAIHKSEDLFLWFLQDCLKSFQGKPTEKLQILDECFPILNKTTDFRLLSLYLSEMAYRLDVEKAWIDRAFRDFRGKNKALDTVKTHKKAPVFIEKSQDNNDLDLSRMHAEEIEIINLILSNEILLCKALDLKLHEYFVTDEGKKILKYMEAQYRQNAQAFATLGNSLLMVFGRSDVLTKHLDESVYSNEEKNTRLFELCVQKLKRVQMKERLLQLKTDLKHGTSTDSLENLREIILATKAKRDEEMQE